MARDCHGDAVRGAGAGYGAHRFGCADGFGDLCIACGRTHRNTAERIPDAMLKGGAAYVQRQIETDMRVLDARGLTLDESIVTGESMAVPRGPGGTLQCGTFVAQGEATALVVATGAKTSLASVSVLAATAERPPSPTWPARGTLRRPSPSRPASRRRRSSDR